MKKLMLVATSIALFSTLTAHAGPLAPVQKNLAAPRIAPMAAAMPRLATMPALSSPSALPGLQLQLGPCTNHVCGPQIPELPPVEIPGWLRYDVNNYPKAVTSWAGSAQKAAVTMATDFVGDVQNPCGISAGGGCGTSEPVGLIGAEVGVISSIGNRALGLTGGIGPMPKPKLPSDH